MTSTPSRPLIPLAFALGVFAITLWAPQVFNDGDTWWHVTAGRLMIARQSVLDTDPFSWTFAGRPWVAHEWLSEVLFGGAFNAGGWGGVQLLTALAAGSAAGLLGRHTGRWTRGLPQACLLLGSLSLCAPHLLARPHVLAWPLLEMWAAELVIARAENRAPRWIVLPLMALWANLHGSFLFGLALVAPFALEALLAAPATARAPTALRWGAFGLAAGAAALLTPHGLTGISHPIRLMTMTSLSGIGEWRPVDFRTFGPIEICVPAAIGFALLRRMKLPPLRLVILLGLLGLAVQHNRHEQLLGFLGALLLAAPLGAVTDPPEARWRVPARWIAAGVAGLAALLAAWRLATPYAWGDSATRPVQALTSVPAAVRATPVLNDFQFGGWLIGQGVRTFIDSRADMYGDAILQPYLRLAEGDRAELARTLASQPIAWAILVAGSPLDRAMAAQPGWRRTHADRWAVVYQRDRPGAR